MESLVLQALALPTNLLLSLLPSLLHMAWHRLVGALSGLVSLVASLPMAGAWKMIFKLPSNPSHSMIIGVRLSHPASPFCLPTCGSRMTFLFFSV